MEGLDGKRVVVTAGGAGIGRATALAFLGQGARVHVCDIDGEALAVVRAEAPELGASLATTVADVADAGDVERLFDEVEATLGGLDILVNNAGISGPTGAIEALSLEDWRRTLAVNLDGQFLCLRRAVPMLKAAGGGSIVNLASTAGVMGFPLRSPYAASKFAVVGLTKSLAIELGHDGIRVNAICPGPVEGARMKRVIAAEAEARGITLEVAGERYTRQNSLGSFVTATDVAALILFICSDAGAKISGQALAVDGDTQTLAGR